MTTLVRYYPPALTTTLLYALIYMIHIQEDGAGCVFISQVNSKRYDRKFIKLQ